MIRLLTIYLIALIAVLSSCNGGGNSSEKQFPAEGNIYGDMTLRRIYELRCSGNSAELIKLFSDEVPLYRKTAVLALGSMRDSMSTVAAASLLSDENQDVRQSAVFAIGQIGHIAGQKYLIEYLKKEESPVVRASILEALGKCGDEKALEIMERVRILHSENDLVLGEIRGFCFLAKRGFFSINGTQKAINILCDSSLHNRIRTIASEYFSLCNTDFSLYTDEFIKVYKTVDFVPLKENIANALGKCHNERAFSFLKQIIKDEKTDYRVVLNAIKALENYPYADCKDLILEQLRSYDEKISSYAACFLYNKGTKADSTLYLDLSREVAGWQTRAYLLATALKYSLNKKNIAKSIQSGFEASQNVYEKASLLRSLATDISSYGFVENQTFYSDNQLLMVEGLKTLIQMYENPEFENYAKMQKFLTGENLVEDFALIFKKAVQNGNSQMVALAASTIASHSEISDYYMNTFFLNQAIGNCILPQDADTYVILIDALKKITGQIVKPAQAPVSDVLDWDYICSIAEGEQIVISTHKGDITLKTDINTSPLAVSNFMKLVDQKYFDNSSFTNISSSYIENRGSISGFEENQSFMIPSELNYNLFDEGTTALFTTALNTSSATQWFIMLTSKSVLDGSSPVIATVVDGMDCVHSLNTGDGIITIKRKTE